MHAIQSKALSILLLIAAVSVGHAAVIEPGSRAPDFALQTVEGDTVRLSDLRGRVVVLEFWATWCGWCRRQMPAMVEAHEAHGDRAVFLMVNSAESASVVTRFIGRHEVPGTILLDPDDAVGEAYGTDILPAVVVVDEEGVVRASVSGALRDVEAFFQATVSVDPVSES
jgi:peroxiredoxin